MSPEQLGELPPEDARRLNADTAHEEANMLRALLRTGMDREENTRDKVKRHEAALPMPEDYDAALNSLEELRKLAAKKPSIAFRLWQYLELSLVTAAVPPVIIATMLAKSLDEQLPAGGKLAREIDKENPGEAWRSARDSIFSDARSRLERLKRESEMLETGDSVA